jgi:hypothetical protein
MRRAFRAEEGPVTSFEQWLAHVMIVGLFTELEAMAPTYFESPNCLIFPLFLISFGYDWGKCATFSTVSRYRLHCCLPFCVSEGGEKEFGRIDNQKWDVKEVRVIVTG